MSTLIICLPLLPGDAATRYEHVLTTDGQTLAVQGVTTASLLPDASRGGDEIVAVLPVEAVSWQSAELPKGVGASSPRLRMVLQSLLEDRLLDEPEDLHLAIGPGSAAGRAAWVAVCDKSWLRQHLQVLETAGRAVSRIVPEFAPHTGALRLQVLGDPGHAQIVMSGQGIGGGVLRLPLTTGSLALVLGREGLQEPVEIIAEPAVASLAEEILQQKAELQQRAQRLLIAAQTPWDLAQFDLASTGRTRTLKRLLASGQVFLRAPQWRAARWGLVLVLMANLVGLNAWAWKEQASWQSRRTAIQSTLTQSFPAVKVVVDAPVQMAREVATLRQVTGTPSNRDLEAILAAAGSALPAGKAVSAIEFAAGEARLKGLNLGAEEAAAVITKLRPVGYTARIDGDVLLIKPGSSP